MAIYPIKMLKDENGNPFIPLVAPEGVVNTDSENLNQMLSEKISEPVSDGTAGQVLTTDGEGGRVWTTVQGGGGGTSDYTILSNKPQINSTTLSGNKTSADLGIENIFRYSTMPTASSTLLGKIIQYIGTTTADYQNGSFYECIASPSTAGTYVWSKISDNGCIYTARSATRATLIIYTPGDTDSSWGNSSAIGAAVGYINKAKENGITQLDITFYDYGDAYNTSCSFLTARFRINPQTNAEISASTNNSILISYNAHGSYSTNYAVVMKCTSTLRVWYSSTTAKYFRMALNFDGISNTSHAYLAKDNTAAYIPTDDYHPATKKYVDDAIEDFNPVIILTGSYSMDTLMSDGDVPLTQTDKEMLLAFANEYTDQGEGIAMGVSVHFDFITPTSSHIQYNLDGIVTIRKARNIINFQYTADMSNTSVDKTIVINLSYNEHLETFNNADIIFTSIPNSDSLPIGSIIDYNGSTVPEGWESVNYPSYSITEQKTGEAWIDGKPIYRKVIQATTASSVGDTVIDVSNLNIKRIINLFGNVGNDNDCWLIGTYYEQLAVSARYYNGDVYIYTNASSLTNKPIYMILEYTKTTD